MSHKDRNKSSVFWQSFTLFPFKTEIEEEVFAFTGNVLLLITGFLVLSLSLWGLVGVSCASPSIKHLTQPCSGRPHMACRPRGCTRASREGSGQGRGQTDDKAIGGGFALASAGCGAPERHLGPCPAWAGWTSASGHLTAHHPPQGDRTTIPSVQRRFCGRSDWPPLLPTWRQAVSRWPCRSPLRVSRAAWRRRGGGAGVPCSCGGRSGRRRTGRAAPGRPCGHPPARLELRWVRAQGARGSAL